MLEGNGFRSTQDGDEGDKRLMGSRGYHGSTGAGVVPNSTACALAAALFLLLGAGGAAAQDTLPTVSVSDAEAYEDGRFVNFEVSLSQASSEQVTVEVATSSGTARSGTDFRAVLRTVTFPAHSTDPQSVLVSLRDDRTPEPDETFTVTLRNPVGATLGDATATGTIRNDDSAATLAASGIGETSATLTISGHTGGWWYKGGEYALGPLGYNEQAFRILRRNVHSCTAVANGTAAVSIGGLTAARSHDYRAYSDSTCSTRLARVKFRTFAPEGTPTVSVSDAEVSEDGDWMDFTVSLSQASRKRVTVRVHTSSGTATSGTDFRHVSRTEVFPANDGTPLSVRVFVHDDEELEPDETFTVRLTNPVGATLGDATGTGTIRDDGDTAATLAASDIEDTTATLTVGGHTNGWWYKGNAHACTAVAAGTTAVRVSGLRTVTDYEYAAYGDSACSTRLARTKFKTLAPEGTPTVSISDAQASEGGEVIFAVSLSQPSRERVTVEVHTSSGTATSWYDFAGRPQTLTFHANDSRITRYARVKVLDDEEPEPDETFTATLRVPVGATLGDGTATGTIRDDGDTAATLTASDIEDTTATLTLAGHTGAWWYQGGNADLCTAVAAGTTAVSISGLTTVTDYEFTAYSDSGCQTKLARVAFGTLAPEGTPTVSISDAEVSEDGTWIDFKVSLSHPSRKRVFVRTETSNGTATGTHGDFTPGIDFRHEFPGMGVIFEANSPVTTKSRSVRVFDDQEPEPDETFTVTLTNPSNVTLGDATATGTILDDGDTAATLMASDIEDTTAMLTISGHTEGWWYKGNAHSCTAVAAGTAAVSIGGLTTLAGYEFTAYSDSGCQTKLARVKFTTLAPAGAPTVNVSDAVASEDSSISFKVSLSHPSREPVTVWYETSGGTATSGTDFTATSYNLVLPANSWNRGYAVGVSLLDDQEAEPDETFTLTLTRATGATLGDATATGTIVDDGDTATTLTASDIEDTTATLTLAGHTDGWWYKGNVHSCTAVAAGTTAVSIGGLTTVTDYEYSAYSDSTCRTKLAVVEFRSIAPEGTPTVSVSDAEAYEDGGFVHFEISLSQPSSEEVTVEFATSSGTATMGTDFRGGSGSLTLTFPPNRKDPRRVSVRLIDDLETEPDETFTVRLTNPTGATLGEATATGTIRNDDTAATLAASGIGDTTATLTISGHTGGWWHQGSDWIGIDGPCTAVAAGTTAVGLSGLTAAMRYDYRAYSDSTCTTRLAKVRFQTLASEGTPTVSVSDAQVSEDRTWMTFVVSLSEPSREKVTVDVRTSDGTATSGTDYRAESETLTFPANSRNLQGLSVLVYDDQAPEQDETFTVTLTNPVGATLGDATAIGTIRDDGDTAARLMPSDIEDTTATLTISGHTGGWWYRGRSLASSPWGGCTAVSAGTTAVGITGLTAATDYEYWAYSDSTCQTKLANVEFGTLAPVGTPTVSISDAQASEDETRMTFLVSLSQPSREEVKVWYETSGGTATGGADFMALGGLRAGRVVFGANSSDTTMRASVLLYDDQEAEPDETFTVTLTNPTGATLGDATATGTIRDDGDTAARLTPSDIEDTTATLTISGHTEGWWYRGRSSGTSSPWGGCTAVSAGTTAVSLSGLTALTDYEYGAFSDSACSTKLAKMEFRTIAPVGMPTVSVSDAQVSEDGTWMTFAVSLSQPSREPVTVWHETSSGTATSGIDFDARPGRVSFSANSLDTTGYASVIVHDDQELEPDETFTLTLTRASNATLGDATTATGTIVDDDGTGTTLAASAIEDTTATLTIGGHTSGWWYKGSAHSCTAVAAGTTAVGISGLTAVTDYEYSAYSDSVCSTKLAKVEFRTLATEGVTPTVSVSDAEVSEDGGRMLFWVSLSQPSRERVTVDVQTSDGAATSGTDYRAESVTLTFPANSRERQLLPVPVHDDRTPEPDETFTVTLTNPVGATLGDATATGTITDDDTAATGVTVVSDPGDDATYAAGDTVKVQLTFAEAVAVDTGEGTPRLKLDLGGDDGAGERWAAYEDGSGTETLTFAWTAVARDESAVGVAVLADTLELNGGTVRSAATQADVALGHPGRDADPAHKVDAVAPRLVRGEIDGGTVTLHFSETLDAGTAGGRFGVDVASGSPTTLYAGFWASGPVSVSGSAVTVGLGAGNPRAKAGLANGNGVLYARRADGGGGALRDVAGNPVLAPDVLPYGGVETWRGSEEWRFVKISLENVTRPAASVTGVEVISDAGSDDTYVLGDTIRVQVTFNETVEVTGTPRLKIDMDPADWGEKWAAYESGSGTGSLTFAHTVVQPNYSTQGIAVLANTLQLNGGTMRADGADADLAHDGRPHDANHKVDWQTSGEGGGAPGGWRKVTAPTVTGVSVVSSPASGSTYLLGETIRIRATFSEAVTVTGSPGISIDMDPAHWGTKRASYASGGGTSSLDFVHTVVEPNYSTQGIAVLANSLALNGGAVRSADGTNAALGHTGLGHNSGHKVDWRPSISVADARADEGAGAAVAFQVSLSRAFTTAAHSVAVDYTTADGSAKAGEDYTATSGTLTFAAGERTKTVNVPVLDDSIDEGEETFVLRLSNATGARIGDGEATGTIANDDPLQKMWLSRFGRTVASDAVATVTARLQTPRDAGSHLTLAGQRVPLDGSGDGRALADALPGFTQAFGALPPPADPGDPIAGHGLTGAWNDPFAPPPARRMTGRELLLGTSFRAVLASDAGMQLTSWGQGASVSRFSGAVPGLSLSGETASGALGMDYERGRLLTGFAMMHSVGEGTAHDEGLRYAMGSTVTTLLPYARYALTDRLSAWGLAGTGSGSLALGLDTGVSPRQRTDLSLTLTAAGVRGELLSPTEAGGVALAFKADAFWVRTESDAVSAPGMGNLAAARGESSRVRAVLDGSRTFAFPGGATLTPSVEFGVRHDGGDAETGTGVELGAGLGYADPSRGLDMALRVHGLSAHAGDGYSEWGVSGSLRLVPSDAGRGLSASLTPSYGVAPGGSQRLWMLPDADAMAATDDVPLSSRLDAEVGYGMAVFGGSFTGTPHVGFGLSEAGRDYRIGWRLTSGAGPLELSLEATRREPADGNGAGYGAGAEPEHTVGVHVGARF